MSDRSTMLGESLCEDEIRPEALLKPHLEAFHRDVERLKSQRSTFVEVPCPGCEAQAVRPAFEKYGFRYVTCERCGTLFMTPRPSAEAMARHYADSDNYRFWVSHLFPASESARRKKLHEPRLDRVVRSCKRFSIPRGTLLEVGPGAGTFCAIAAASGAFDHVVAIEPVRELAEACRARGVRVINKCIEEISDEIDPVDVAVAFEVIEHVFSPRRFLERCHRLLRPGGQLVLTCPNGEGFDIALLGRESVAIDPGHINLFNPASLGLLLESCGFELLEAATPGRLDAELVRKAIQEDRFDVSQQPFLRRVLIDDWERLGWPFQQFLAENGLSSHLWVVARKESGVILRVHDRLVEKNAPADRVDRRVTARPQIVEAP